MTVILTLNSKAIEKLTNLERAEILRSNEV